MSTGGPRTALCAASRTFPPPAAGATQIVGLTLSYRHAPLAIRELAAFSPNQITEALAALRLRVSEAFILSTCNRIEVYAVAPSASEGHAALRELLRDCRGLTRMELHAHARRLDHQDAVRHLHRVAAGLESRVIGEDEVLEQLRRALSVARAAGALGPILERLGASAVNGGRRARSARGTLALAPQQSVMTLAIQAAERVMGSLRGRRVVVIGAGAAASATCSALAERRIGELVVVNRTLARASALAERHGGEGRAWRDRIPALASADAAFVCTVGDGYAVETDALRAARHTSQASPLVCVDVAMPRSVEPDVALLPGVRLLNVDDLQPSDIPHPFMPESSAWRKREIEVAVERFGAWWNEGAVRPVIAALRQKADVIRDSEVDRALARLPELSAGERYVVRGLARRIVGALLDAPTSALKEGDSATELASAAERLFGLAAAAEGPASAAEAPRVIIQRTFGRSR